MRPTLCLLTSVSLLTFALVVQPASSGRRFILAIPLSPLPASQPISDLLFLCVAVTHCDPNVLASSPYFMADASGNSGQVADGSQLQVTCLKTYGWSDGSDANTSSNCLYSPKSCPCPSCQTFKNITCNITVWDVPNGVQCNSALSSG